MDEDSVVFLDGAHRTEGDSTGVSLSGGLKFNWQSLRPAASENLGCAGRNNLHTRWYTTDTYSGCCWAKSRCQIDNRGLTSDSFPDREQL